MNDFLNNVTADVRKRKNDYSMAYPFTHYPHKREPSHRLACFRIILFTYYSYKFLMI